MDTVVHDEEQRAELAVLRRRAFGPDADILDDPAALERLRELEGSLCAESPVVLSFRSDPPSAYSDGVDGGLDPDGDVLDPEGEVSSGEGGGKHSARVRPYVSRLREAAARFATTRPRRVTAVVAGALLIAAAGGGIGWQIAQPRPDRILAADDTHYTPTGQGTDLWLKEMYGITGAFRGHEPYGHVHVFTARARDGSECMVLMIGTDDAVGTSCSPRPLPASADLFVFPGWSRAYTGLDLPAGSIVRFVQAGDEVEVWTAVMPSTAPTL